VRGFCGDQGERSPGAVEASMIRHVPNFQQIHHGGRLAAVVVAGEAIIDDTLSDHAFASVQAKCLYALELTDRGETKAYTDEDAEAYAQAALGGG
jgi:hypothetical protein